MFGMIFTRRRDVQQSVETVMQQDKREGHPPVIKHGNGKSAIDEP